MGMVLYILMGFLDVMAVLTLVFKLFRFPIGEYRKEFVNIALTLSCSSYILRDVLGVPDVDMSIQFILFALFFRYLLRFRTFETLMLTTIGFLGFSLVQLVMIPLMSTIGIISLSDLELSHGSGIFLFQLITDLMVFLISYLLYKFHLGFSFVMCPPHEVTFKSRYDLLSLSGIMAGSLGIFAAMYIAMNYFERIHILTVTMLISFLLLIVASHKKERDDH
ncbi:MAG: hypothetical protein ACM32O_11770 [Clostridia bacterium]